MYRSFYTTDVSGSVVNYVSFLDVRQKINICYLGGIILVVGKRGVCVCFDVKGFPIWWWIFELYVRNVL